MIVGVERGPVVALAVTGGLVVAGIATRLARVPEPGESATAILPLLLAVALLLMAILAAERASGVAWPAAVAAGILAVREPVALAASMQGAAGLDGAGNAWLPAALLVGLSSTAAVAVAALYVADAAAAGGRVARLVAWASVTWQAIGASASIALSLAGRRDDPAGFPLFHVVTAPVAYWPALPVVLGAAGALLAVRGPVRRAMAGRDPLRPGDLAGVAGALGDELLGRASSRRASEQRERARLAAELHADILPALRAAVAELEAGGDPAVVRARLAGVATDVQALSLERRNLILEELGLVAALEAMAERAEERAGASIEIDIAAPSGGASGADRARTAARPPLPVERAALRIAELAVANAARHGTGTARLAVGADAARIDLRVSNAGPAYDPDAARAALRRGARGVTEMREAAAAVDGELEIGPGVGGGAVVQFRWPRG